MKKTNARLIKKIRAEINKIIRNILKDDSKIIPPIPKRYLPRETYLRELYNQAYYCHYAGMYDASLALLLVCLERISRDLYKQFSGNETKKSWDNIIIELEKFFRINSNTKEIKYLNEFLKNVKIIKDDVRNLLLHGKIEKFVEDTKIIHKAFNISTQKFGDLTINYNSELHNFGKVKTEKIYLYSHKILILLSVTIIQLNQYIDKRNIYK